jgi:hypothetical protein
MRLEQYQLRLTYHGHKRYCERVGRIKRHTLYERCVTCLRVGHYRFGENLIRLYGVWWGCAVDGSVLSLTTCYGHQQNNMIVKRYKDRTRREAVWRS